MAPLKLTSGLCAGRAEVRLSCQKLVKVYPDYFVRGRRKRPNSGQVRDYMHWRGRRGGAEKNATSADRDSLFLLPLHRGQAFPPHNCSFIKDCVMCTSCPPLSLFFLFFFTMRSPTSREREQKRINMQAIHRSASMIVIGHNYLLWLLLIMIGY